MTYAKRIEHWGERHHPGWVDILRIALGIFLFVKGIAFARDTEALSSLIARENFDSFPVVLLAHFIIFAHIVGGFFIATGLLTRASCAVNIPILLGALVFVNWQAMHYMTLLPVSILTLLLLIYFLIVGSGPFSLDRVLFRYNGQVKTDVSGH
ncbi:DoxX family protein [Flaviaesturariibacter flavus]|uniref:DoxX family protein n=1 Tax=Flaviaesturariibacter flavus TaxID=2502780 RepID=A0A4R1B5M0_9BACT|nr:DoxX family protein [Flaviaesturariibacter flavus]TCJ13291.1 DoxX family protein [Flaviaesturariibacter flavus]